MNRNPIFGEIKTNVNSTPLKWSEFIKEHLVSDDTVHVFQELEKLSISAQHEYVSNSAQKFANAVKDILREDHSTRLTAFALIFIIDYSSVAEIAEFLASQNTTQFINSLLSSKDEDIKCLAALAMASIISNAKTTLPEEQVLELFEYTVHERLLKQHDDSALKELAANILEAVLQKPVYRKLFRPYAPIVVPQLMDLIATGSVQLQYSSLLVMWILSFDKPIILSIPLEFNVIPRLLQVAKSGIKEKVVRLSVATIANYVKLDPKNSISIIIAEGSLQNGKVLPEKKWKDEELLQDLAFLNETITKAFERMTTFEEYHSELHAHKLRWSPVHNNRAFWIENIGEFKRNDWHYLKKLLKLILSSKDDVTLAVGCRDLSSVLTEAPEAVHIISKTGGKVKVMELIGNKNPEIRYEALRTSQLMLANLLA